MLGIIYRVAESSNLMSQMAQPQHFTDFLFKSDWVTQGGIFPTHYT